MSEYLTVRLSRQAQSPISWLVWSTSQNEIIASGELSDPEKLSELVPYAQQRTTQLLLDNRDLVLVDTEIPPGASRQLTSMLPFLLEDDLAQDIEQLHFSVLGKNAGRALVAVIDGKYLASCLAMFDKVGIEVRKVLPDALCLPLSNDAISALQIDNQWLFRKGSYEAISVEQEWLPLFLQSAWCQGTNGEGTSVSPDDSSAEADEKSAPQQRIIAYSQVPDLEVEGIAWEASGPDVVMELLAKGAMVSQANLLTGKFKTQSSLLKHLKVWRKVALAACVFIALLSVQKYMQINQFEEQAKAYRAESERIFRTVFPTKRKIPTVSYLKRQMTDEENRLQGGGTDDTVFDWLTELSALREKESTEIKSFRYDANRGEIRIEALMEDFQAFEVARVKLAENFTVTQGPLDKENGKVAGSFVLRRK